jgi:hypothetical protein
MDLFEDSDSPQVADLREDAINFLLKPSSRERIHEDPDIPFRKTLETPLSMSPKLAIKTKRKKIFIDPADIAAVETEGKYVLLRRNSGTCLLRQSISTIADELKPYGFLRIHRSVLVNASCVEEVHPRNTENTCSVSKAAKNIQSRALTKTICGPSPAPGLAPRASLETSGPHRILPRLNMTMRWINIFKNQLVVRRRIAPCRFTLG